MKFTMPIDKTVATKVGHSILFEAGVPTHVPKEAWREVQAAGAVPEDYEAVREKRKTDDEIVIDDPVERKERIFAAFTVMVEANKRGDFGASGAPHHKPLSDTVGFEVGPKERDELWSEFQQVSAEGQEKVDAAQEAVRVAKEKSEAADKAAAERAAEDRDAERAAAAKSVKGKAKAKA